MAAMLQVGTASVDFTSVVTNVVQRGGTVYQGDIEVEGATINELLHNGWVPVCAPIETKSNGVRWWLSKQ